MTPASSASPHGLRSGGAALALALLFAGCGKTDPASYRIPKEKDAELPASLTRPAATAPTPADQLVATPAAAPRGPLAGTTVPPAGGPGLTWTAPAAWQPKPVGARRQGSFTVPGDAGATADLAITAFPGAVGGELANINRWRGQVSLPPIAESDRAAAATRFTANGLSFTVVDLAGADPANPQRILGGMTPYRGAMGFFKLTGPDALVARARPAFLDFLPGVKPGTP